MKLDWQLLDEVYNKLREMEEQNIVITDIHLHPKIETASDIQLYPNKENLPNTLYGFSLVLDPTMPEDEIELRTPTQRVRIKNLS